MIDNATLPPRSADSALRTVPQTYDAPLSEKIHVKASSIHGLGCFASREILKGELLGRYEGPTVKRDGTYVLWVLQENGEYIGINGQNELRYLNHSSRFNAEFQENSLFAIKKIKPGEEIKIHYGEEWDDVP